MYQVIAAFVAALPAFFFAWVALKQRNEDSYEDRLEKENAGLRKENAELQERVKVLASRFEECQDETLRLMKKLLKNGGTE